MTKRKKRNAVTLVSLLLALAALIGVYVWYSSRPTKDDSSSDDTEKISLAKIDTSKVTELHYTGGEDADIELVLQDGEWISKTDPKRPINQDNITSMLKLISDITATRKVTDTPDSLADYGLEKPYASVLATLKDGSKVSLKIGDETVTSDGYYAMVDDKKTVYLVGTDYGSGLNYSDVDFTKKEETPTITAANITYIKVDQKSGQDVELKYQDYTSVDNSGSNQNQWQYLKPYGEGYTADSTAISTLQSKYTTFELVSCVDYTGKNFDKYGLKKPTATIDIGYYEEQTVATPTPSGDATSSNTASTIKTNKEFKLYIGDKNEAGQYYVRPDGSDMVYTMDASSVDAMLQIDTFSLISPYMNIPNIMSVDKVTADIAGKEYSMTLSHKTTKDSDGNKTTKSTYYYNGTKSDESAFQGLYTKLISPKYDGELTDKVDISSLQPVMTLSFHITGDTETTIKTSYLPYNDSFYIVDKGTGKYFLTDKRSIDDLMSAIETFNPVAATPSPTAAAGK